MFSHSLSLSFSLPFSFSSCVNSRSTVHACMWNWEIVAVKSFRHQFTLVCLYLHVFLPTSGCCMCCTYTLCLCASGHVYAVVLWGFSFTRRFGGGWDCWGEDKQHMTLLLFCCFCRRVYALPLVMYHPLISSDATSLWTQLSSRNPLKPLLSSLPFPPCFRRYFDVYKVSA